MISRYGSWAVQEKRRTGISPRRWVERLGWLRVRALLQQGEAHTTEAFRASIQLPLFRGADD